MNILLSHRLVLRQSAWLASLLALVLSLSTFAEEPLINERRQAEMAKNFEEMVTRLKLTDGQKEQLDPILRESAMQSFEIMKQYGITEEPGALKKLSFSQKRAFGKEMKAVKQDTDTRVKSVLSKEQFKEYGKIQKERREEMKKRRKQQAEQSQP